MPILVNKDSGFAEDLVPEVAKSAIAQGTHDLPLNDPQGNAVVAPHEQAAGLLQQGYSQPSQEQLGQMLSAAKQNKPIHHILGAVEALGRGLAGPALDIAERASGEKPEDIRARADLDPALNSTLEAAGLVGSSLMGGGLGGSLEAAGKAFAPKTIGKIGSTAAKAGIENALFQTGNEISKLMQNDPQQSVGSAAANIGLSALLGGAIGGGFGVMSKGWDALAEGKAASFVSDFKGRLQQHIDNPDPLGNLTKELEDYHGAVQNQALREVYGATGLRQQELQKILPAEMTPELLQHNTEVINKIGDALGKMQTAAHEYPAHNVSELQRQYQNLTAKVQDPVATPLQAYNALNEFKQYAQGTYKALQRTDKFELPYKFLNTVKDLGQNVRDSLENNNWGAAGERTAQINKAWAQFQIPLKDFNSKFATKVGDNKVIDPGKVQTYYNQLGDAKAEIKQEVMDNFMKAANQFTAAMDKTHASLGIENTAGKSSISAINSTLEHFTPGAKVADQLVKHGLGKLAGGAIGAGMGIAVGHPVLGAMLGQHAIGPMFDGVLPGVLRPLLSQAPSGAGFKAAIQFGLAVSKGESTLGKLTHAVFNGGRMEIPAMDAKVRDKLKDRIQHLSQNPQDMLQDNQIGHYLPEHSSALSAFTAGAISYLNQIAPKTAPTSPLGQERIPSKTEEANYDSALDIAQNPNVVLPSIQNGSLTMQELAHLKALHPQYMANMQQKLMQSLIDAKTANKQIPYAQQLSMGAFMQQPLDNSSQPMSIMANQATFAPSASAPNPQQHQQHRPSQHGLDKLGKMPLNYQTPMESRQMQRHGQR